MILFLLNYSLSSLVFHLKIQPGFFKKTAINEAITTTLVSTLCSLSITVRLRLNLEAFCNRETHIIKHEMFKLICEFIFHGKSSYLHKKIQLNLIC